MTKVACGDCFVMTHDLFIRAIFPTAKFENAHKARLCKDHFSQFQYLSSSKRFLQNTSKSYIKHSTKMIKRKRQLCFHCMKYGIFLKCFAGMVGLAVTLKYGGVNAERCYKWEKKSLMHCNVVDQHLKGLGRLIRWRTTTLGSCHLTLNIWKKRKKMLFMGKESTPVE